MSKATGVEEEWAKIQSEPVTVDMTPTWAAVLPILMAGLEYGDDEGRKAARSELVRMAGAADKFNAQAGTIEYLRERLTRTEATVETRTSQVEEWNRVAVQHARQRDEAIAQRDALQVRIEALQKALGEAVAREVMGGQQ